MAMDFLHTAYARKKVLLFIGSHKKISKGDDKSVDSR